VTVTDQNPLFGTDWETRLRQEFMKSSWVDLQAFVVDERSRFAVYPPDDQVFRALHLTSLTDTQVVILGQDPYHGSGQAHGLAFSVPYGIRRPPSLRNIHKELNEDLGVPIPDHGNLEQWACRGVLLLNATLTVRNGAAASHRGRGWEALTDLLIGIINGKTDRVAFMLWGKEAQKKRKLIDPSRHTIIESSHPAPQSARRGPKPFLGSRPFSRASHALVAAGLRPIDWRLTD
jgi:uracil-DNA glycosylase